jgi:hypothetical protein
MSAATQIRDRDLADAQRRSNTETGLPEDRYQQRNKKANCP